MSKITQQFQLLAPKAAAQNEVKTFVYSKDVIVKNSSTEEERLYSVLTIWAPTKDIDKIFAHLMQVFYKCCRIETSNESIMVRFNRTLESINTILEVLQINFNFRYRFVKISYSLFSIIVIFIKT